MKRKLNYYDGPAKRTRYTLKHKQSNLQVSGTDIRNYLQKDTLVDWFKVVRPKRHLPFSLQANSFNFMDFLMQKGKDFEQELINYIRETICPVITVSDRINVHSCRETIRLMKLGVPVIHSAPFLDEETQTKGIVDLLVRSDYLKNLIVDNPLPEHCQFIRSPRLNGNYHYVVIDIKFSTLPLRADGVHLLNSGSYPAYKGQLRIYTEAIGNIQEYVSQYAFILGRRWNYTKKDEKFSGQSCLDRLGVIDYGGVDADFVQKTQDAIQWVRDVRQNGKNWSINPPSRVELYPNMCIDSGEWNNEKNEIANQIGDITQIWYCGTKNREIALSKGINSWRNKRCCSKTIGVNGVRAHTVDQIIDINRQNSELVRPLRIETKLYEWREQCTELFVDFETFCDIFASFEELPEQPKTDKIFMIGVYYKEGDNYEYKNFVANAPTDEEEFLIMDQFAQFVRSFPEEPKLWYWHADKAIWTKAENHQMDLACMLGLADKADHIVDNWRLDNWADLCQVFRDEPIVIKDCFKFGLKEIASALYKHTLIDTELESECKSGLDASIRAWKVYESCDDPANHPEILDIARYNQFDVKAVWDILQYIRNNH